MSEIEQQGNTADEAPLDAARPIIDPHHHLWDHGSVPGVASGSRPFLLPEFQQVIDDSGHNITHTVYVECVSMYRREGPKDFRPVGETEFANGMAAMGASGRYGSCRIVAGIVATANLRLGSDVVPVLEAQVAAGNGRLRGLRFSTAYGEAGLFGREPDPSRKGVLLDGKFREGVRAMQQFGLSLDVWCLHTQLGELASLAAACQDMLIVLDHLGTPLKLDAAAGGQAEVFPRLRDSIMELARRPNVVVKLGGLGMDVAARIGTTGGRVPSATLADDWRPYVETCVDAFGVGRCMFESNFPVDSRTCSYGELWNAFKRISEPCSEDEKTALFSGTAAACYRLA
jgi:predicted TIM-barrel fold metal-dependent hydrolase